MNIEPTEEQKQAANAFMLKTRIAEEDSFASRGLAWLLAEREAKLREECMAKAHARVAQVMRDNDQAALMLDASNRREDTLRARVADLETVYGSYREARARIAQLEADNTVLAEVADDVVDHLGVVCANYDSFTHPKYFGDQPVPRPLVDAVRVSWDATHAVLERYRDMYRYGTPHCLVETLQHREAQHLADIKALMEAAVKVSMCTAGDGPCWCSYPIQPGTDHHMCCQHMRATLKRLAHYDDAKVDAPAVDAQAFARGGGISECPKCQDRTAPFFDVEQARWLCDRCHHPAGEPFVHDAEGGEG